MQRALVATLAQRHGMAVVGYKAGATNAAAQARMGLAAPFLGPLFARDIRRSPARVAPDEFVVRGVELEYAFEMGAELPCRAPGEPDYTLEEVLSRVRAV